MAPMYSGVQTHENVPDKEIRHVPLFKQGELAHGSIDLWALIGLATVCFIFCIKKSEFKKIKIK